MATATWKSLSDFLHGLYATRDVGEFSRFVPARIIKLIITSSTRTRAPCAYPISSPSDSCTTSPCTRISMNRTAAAAIARRADELSARSP